MGINAYFPTAERWKAYTMMSFVSYNLAPGNTVIAGQPGAGKRYLVWGWAAGTNDADDNDRFSGSIESGLTVGTAVAFAAISCNIHGPIMQQFEQPIVLPENHKIVFDDTNVPASETTPINMFALYYSVEDVA